MTYQTFLNFRPAAGYKPLEWSDEGKIRIEWNDSFLHIVEQTEDGTSDIMANIGSGRSAILWDEDTGEVRDLPRSPVITGMIQALAWLAAHPWEENSAGIAAEGWNDLRYELAQEWAKERDLTLAVDEEGNHYIY